MKTFMILSIPDKYIYSFFAVGYQLIKEYRGQARYDMEAIVECLLRLSQLITEILQIKELEMNLVKVLEKGEGILIMDAKAVLKEKEPEARKMIARSKKVHELANHF